MKLIEKIKSITVNTVTPFLVHKPDIILLGDSNTLISYFGVFSKYKWSAILSKRLSMKIGNFGRDGATTEDFLNSKRLRRAIKLNAKYYIICFGLNDEKTRNLEQFKSDTINIINEIKNKTDGIPILMTNLKVDYQGGRYNYNRNDEKIIPYDNVKRKITKEYGIQLIDVYSRFENEIEKGNWDHRIRNTKVFDNTEDQRHEKDSKWFSNIHYNRNGNQIVADEVIKHFRLIESDSELEQTAN